MQDQPPPQKNNGVPIWDLVISDATPGDAASPLIALMLADMRERDRVGRERYGAPLQANNGRDYLTDAYQENLDMCAYLRQGIEEDKVKYGVTNRNAAETYDAAMRLLLKLRKRILERDGK